MPPVPVSYPQAMAGRADLAGNIWVWRKEVLQRGCQGSSCWLMCQEQEKCWLWWPQGSPRAVGETPGPSTLGQAVEPRAWMSRGSLRDHICQGEPLRKEGAEMEASK